MKINTLFILFYMNNLIFTKYTSLLKTENTLKRKLKENGLIFVIFSNV